jgi:hypothetical protein
METSKSLATACSLDAMAAKELKVLARRVAVPVSGLKSELVVRLLMYKVTVQDLPLLFLRFLCFPAPR